MEIPKTISFALNLLVLLLIVQTIQCRMLNKCFVDQFNEYLTPYCIFFILDIFCVCVFTCTFILSYQHFFTCKEISFSREEKKKSVKWTYKVNTLLPNVRWGVLPMCYVSWLIYTSVLVGKLSVFYGHLHDLSNSKLENREMLQV